MLLPQSAGQQLQERLGHVFRNHDLLLEALTHSTFAYEHRQIISVNNERLEFLGDAVLDLAISDVLFRLPESHAEGFMTKTRALVVCENSLAALARKIDLGSLLLLGKGEEATGGRDKNSNLSNAVEALFGAIYLDAGYDKACRVIQTLLQDAVQDALAGSIVYDFKSQLYELVQGSLPGSFLRFSILDEQGPVHERLFTAGALLNDQLIAQGSGSSKKEAEQKAAQAALAYLETIDVHQLFEG